MDGVYHATRSNQFLVLPKVIATLDEDWTRAGDLSD
jgi:hypothetical protein